VRESLSIVAAARFSGKSENTIRLWAMRYGIGRKIGGDWDISRVAVRIFLDGDMAALATYHTGDRTNPLVRPYFERTGCAAHLHHSAGNMGAVSAHYHVSGTFQNISERVAELFKRAPHEIASWTA
jgi:hypothetical protein